MRTEPESFVDRRWNFARALGWSGQSDSTDQLQTIVVVGQKENLGIENTPEAITALTADALAQNWIESAEDLNGAVPGLLIGESDGYNFDLTIRGIGLNSPQDTARGSRFRCTKRIFIPNPLSLSLCFLDLDHSRCCAGRRAPSSARTRSAAR